MLTISYDIKQGKPFVEDKAFLSYIRISVIRSIRLWRCMQIMIETSMPKTEKNWGRPTSIQYMIYASKS